MVLESTGREVQETARALARPDRENQPSRSKEFRSDPAWAALRETGTRLWLDTGDVDAAAELWSAEFENLTTNNTLVNQEVQKGLFDDAILEIGQALRDADAGLSRANLVLETGFVVNCRTALRLVDAFDATVSVELHPGIARDADLSVDFGRRYYAICPERFIVKVPLTPAGYVAARRLAAEGVPVNFTLGFSARQNVLAAAFSRPAFVNVFMGRLNSVVADNDLGDGVNMGEKVTMATQMAVRQGRAERGWTSALIGASMRAPSQVRDLAGLDVFTMPVAVAASYRERFDPDDPPRSRIGAEFPVTTDLPAVRALWEVEEGLTQAAEDLAASFPATGSGEALHAALEAAGIGFIRRWTREELAQVRADGKIPRWDRWRGEIEAGRLGLDDLMNAAALQSFVADQEALDNRIQRLLEEHGL
jgi:transaldolase